MQINTTKIVKKQIFHEKVVEKYKIAIKADLGTLATGQRIAFVRDKSVIYTI